MWVGCFRNEIENQIEKSSKHLFFRMKTHESYNFSFFSIRVQYYFVSWNNIFHKLTLDFDAQEHKIMKFDCFLRKKNDYGCFSEIFQNCFQNEVGIDIWTNFFEYFMKNPLAWGIPNKELKSNWSLSDIRLAILQGNQNVIIYGFFIWNRQVDTYFRNNRKYNHFENHFDELPS